MKNLDTYTKNFNEFLDRSGMSNADLAQEVGVDPSYVSQWKTNRRPIPADKAVTVGKLLGVDPALISEAYEKVASAGIATAGTENFSLMDLESQPKRLDPDMLAESFATLSEMYAEEKGKPYDLIAEPERFVLVYEARTRMKKNPSASDERRFGAKVAEIVRLKGAELHGQRDGLPAEGPDKGGMAGGVQRKKG